MFGRFTHAIVCRVPSTFHEAVGIDEPINVREAQKEHATYVETLRNLGLDVVELPSDESFPDSVFVEDTAVICNGVALICRPGHPSRAKEVDTTRAILKRELKVPCLEMDDPTATLDGGDVLFTGREFFVGISNRTNEAGARALANTWPEYPVTPIKIPKKMLHLKSCISMAGQDILCIGTSPEAQQILKKIEREATFRYYTVTVPDDAAANVMYINGELVFRSEFSQSVEVLDSRIDYPKVGIKAYELCKPQANLSSMCLLIEKSRKVHL